MNVFTILFDHLLITLLICCWSGKSMHDYKNYKDIVSSSTVRSINAVNCMDTVIVDREGSFGAGSSRQVIVPQSNFFCNGRLTGFVVSLYDYENDNQFLPHIQVWRRSRNSSSLYKLIGQVQPKDDEIIQRRGYFLANVTLSVMGTLTLSEISSFSILRWIMQLCVLNASDYLCYQVILKISMYPS